MKNEYFLLKKSFVLEKCVELSIPILVQTG